MPDRKKIVNKNETMTVMNPNIKNILYEVKPIILTEYISGIIRFQVKDGNLIVPSWKMKCYSIILTMSFAIAFGLVLKLPTALTGDGNLVDMFDELPPMAVLVQYVTTAISTTTLLNKRNIDIINTFAELDSQLIKTNRNNYYVKYRNSHVKGLLLLVLSHLIIVAANLATEDMISTSTIITFPVYLIQKHEILVFCIFVTMLKRRLTVINNYIAKFLEEIDGNNSSVFTICDMKDAAKQSFNLIGTPFENNMKIRDLAIMYDLIGEICSSINSVFNFQIFMTLVSTFIYIVITIWTSLFYYKTPENNSGPLITIAIWCTTTVLTVVVMCLVCERLRAVRNRTTVLINQVIMDYDLPKTMRVQAKAFMELIEAWPLRILIYDMFSVDITLMLKFISVSTTYLIVIIQISHFL